MQSAQDLRADSQPLASSSSSSCPFPARTHATERSRRKRHLGKGMLALLCGSTAGALEDALPPIERSKNSHSRPSSPTVRKGSLDEKNVDMSATVECATPNTPKSNSKPRGLPSRRPSVSQRIRSLSKMSDRAFSNAASSILRRGSAQAPPMPPPAHSRGASISSFTSGKSSNSSSSSKPVIGSPSAFKHQFHLGPDSQRSGPWDESRWRQIVEMRAPEESPVIDVSKSSENSDPAPSQPRASTSSERCGPADTELSRSFSTRSSHSRSRSHSQSQGQLDFATFAASVSATASSPNLLGNVSSANFVGEDGKTPKHLKRSSLVKRKPVPPLYPDEPSPALSPETLPESAPVTKTEFLLIPDPPSDPNSRPLSPVVPEEVLTAMSELSNADSSSPPEHIVVSRPTSPAPAPPPRRHALGHTASLRRRPPLVGPAKLKSAPTIDTSVASSSEETPTATEVPRTPQRSVAVETVQEEGPQTSYDASPKPSFSSLASGSASEPESSPEPRTPRDDRRVSAGSSASVGVLIIETSSKADDKVTEEAEAGSPAKRRSPPARRSPIKEETVYVTADEAETENE